MSKFWTILMGLAMIFFIGTVGSADLGYISMPIAILRLTLTAVLIGICYFRIRGEIVE